MSGSLGLIPESLASKPGQPLAPTKSDTRPASPCFQLRLERRAHWLLCHTHLPASRRPLLHPLSQFVTRVSTLLCIAQATQLRPPMSQSPCQGGRQLFSILHDPCFHPVREGLGEKSRTPPGSTTSRPSHGLPLPSYCLVSFMLSRWILPKFSLLDLMAEAAGLCSA